MEVGKSYIQNSMHFRKGGIITYLVLVIGVFFILNYFGVTAEKLEGIFNTAWYGYLKPIAIAIYNFILNYIILPAGSALKRF